MNMSASKVVALEVGSNKNRVGDSSSPPLRSNRFIQDESRWYFRTRENKTIGPYHSRVKAERSAKCFTRFANKYRGDNLGELINSHLGVLASNNRQSEGKSLALRAGEWEVPGSRDTRIYLAAEQWFFKTREGSSVGPYKTRKEVQESSQLFSDFAQTINSRSVGALITTMNMSLASPDPEPE